MAYDHAAIVESINGLFEGSSGVARTLPSGVFQRSRFLGRDVKDKQAIALQAPKSTMYLFQVMIGALVEGPASPMSAMGSYELDEVEVFIAVIATVATVVAIGDPDAVIAALSSACQDAVQALKTPHNLDEDTTGVVSGCLERVRMIAPAQEDWDMKYVEAHITGILNLQIDSN
jgi:hypothetical protein